MAVGKEGQGALDVLNGRVTPRSRHSSTSSIRCQLGSHLRLLCIRLMTSRSWIFGRTHSYCLSPDAPHPFRNLPRHVISVGATWANGQLVSNHAKLVAVDDEAFYIGSQNLYPGRLQELGVIVEIEMPRTN